MDLSSLTKPFRYYTRGWRDSVDNHDRATGRRRLLFIRHPLFKRFYYRTFLHWLAREFPEIYATCETRSLPFRVKDWRDYAVAMSWVGDSKLAPSSWELAALRKVEKSLQAHAIPLINSLDSTLQASKHEGSQAMARAGLPTPRTQKIHDRKQFQQNPGDFPFPLLIRENHGHAGIEPILTCTTQDELRRADLSRFRQPVAVEFIDVRESQGLCRRFRYLAAGDVGNSHNIHVSRNWEVRGQCRITNKETAHDEQEFISRPNPHHPEFQKARQALGLDLAGFDYSYDQQGRLVVWEVNSLPGVTYETRPERTYLNPNCEAGFAAILRLLLVRGNLPVPQQVYDILNASPATTVPNPGPRISHVRSKFATTPLTANVGY